MKADEKIEKYDVALVGGGLVGAVAALSLSQFTDRDFKLLLIERPDFASPKRHEGRAYALSEGSRMLLEMLGLWQAIEPHAQPIEEIDITDSELETVFRPVFLHFEGEIAMGRPGAYIIEHEVLAEPIYDQLFKAQNIHIHTEGAFSGLETGIESGLDAAELLFDDGSETAQALFKADLVIGADGRGSRVRDFAGIKTFTSDYNQDGIVVTVELRQPHGGKAVQHFLPSGPFAILPLTNDRASLVWTEARGVAAEMCALSDDEFIGEVNKRFSPKLGTVALSGRRGHFPLSLLLARSFIGPRVVLIGDAAHGVHPLAGQGMNIGFRDVAALTEILVETRRLGLDIGGDVALTKYQTWRRSDGVMSAFAMDGLNRLFTAEASSLRELRGFGLRLVDRLPPVKDFFVKEAAGVNGDVPKLMQGLEI
ncbi:MAG: 2-octaprenyl-6-methoxyphenyl hydroxylase [Rhodomicrobium sp.]|nr:MAG: 2-octaprenyl-6-methoxyphenyl hydroxylase [Rhodomicrobium sp.]